MIISIPSRHIAIHNRHTSDHRDLYQVPSFRDPEDNHFYIAQNFLISPLPCQKPVDELLLRRNGKVIITSQSLSLPVVLFPEHVQQSSQCNTACGRNQ
jgi:hypothetical protein